MSVIVAELAAKLGLKVDKKSWSLGNDVIAGLGKALAVFAGYKIITSMKSMVESTIEVGDHAVKAAQKIGITAEAVQELSYAAEASGTSFDSVSAALGRLAVGMEEVRKTGKGPTADALRSLGIRMRDLKGETLDQNLEVIAERFSKMPDGAKKAALAMQLFGKSGKDLIPFLNGGQEGIVKLRAEAQELGVVIGEDAAKEMENVGDDIGRVKSSLIGLRNQAVVALLPTIKELVTNLLGWIKANRQMLSQKLGSFIKALAGLLMFFGKAIAFVVEHWEAFAALLAGVAFVTAIIRIIKLIQFLQMASTMAAAKMLLAWAAAALPLVLIAIGIAALVLAFTRFRKQTFAALNWIKEKFFALGRWIKGHWYLLLLGPFSLLGAAIIAIFEKVWAKIKEGANDLWKWIKSLPGKAIDAFTGTAGVSPEAMQEIAKKRQQIMDRMRAGAEPGRPAATVGGATAEPLAFNVDNMNITTPPGADPEQYRTAVADGIQEWWAKERRHAYAGTGVA